MLKKLKRLRAQEVEEVLKKGRSVRSTHLQLKCVAASDFRIAATAPKSLARKAVARNSLRRALYRAIAALPSPAVNVHAVVFVRAIPKEKAEGTFISELPDLFAKL